MNGKQILQDLKLKLRRGMKHLIGVLLLNPWYQLHCLLPVDEQLVILVDGHQDKMPHSMAALAKELKKYPKLKVVEYFHDYSFCGALRGLLVMLRFMPLYARARYVFISDSYVPVSSCRKRKETTVVQLWHSCGLMKRIGADSAVEQKSIAPRQYRNFDVFTTSAPCVSDTMAAAMGIPRSIFSEAGVSRMDLQYDAAWVAQNREQFLRDYPEYRGKKLILWAPTFRGSAQNGYLVGKEEILRLQQELPDDHALIIKTHRFARSKDMDTPVHWSAELIQMFADILITDYSSIYFDFLYFRRPMVLFAPDLQEYQQTVGLYPEYASLPGRIAGAYDDLREAVLTADIWADQAYRDRMDELWAEQMIYCDGHSTKKLLKQIGLYPETDPLC